ncbi:MAG: OmpA family protein [Burkholderiaceae bacterium]
MATVVRKLRADLPRDVANITESVDQRVLISFPAEAVFAAGRSALLPRATPWLDRIAALVRDLPRSELQILGEADPNSRDARSANAQALDRAASARDWMVARGVAARRIAVAGRQLATPATREARRLDILIGERTPKLR